MKDENLKKFMKEILFRRFSPDFGIFLRPPISSTKRKGRVKNILLKVKVTLNKMK